MLGVLGLVLVLQDDGLERLEAGGIAARVDEGLILLAGAEDDVHQRVDEHDVGVGPQREVDPAEVDGVARRLRQARVDDDLLVVLREHPVVEDGPGLVAVGAGQTIVSASS